jgi:RNA polymerase sigma factor (sigma-70 family)
MNRRISLNASDFDQQVNELAFSDEESSRAEASERLKKVMARIIRDELTKRQKEMVALYYYNQCGVSEIAQMLGVAPSTVSRTIKRARDRIYRYLKYYYN